MKRPEHIVSKSGTVLFRVTRAAGFTGGGYVVQSRFVSEKAWTIATPRVFFRRDLAEIAASYLAATC